MVVENDSGIDLQQWKIDGDAMSNQFVMLFLADLLGTEKARQRPMTLYGADVRRGWFLNA